MRRFEMIQDDSNSFRPIENNEKLPDDIISEPRIPIHSKRHFDLSKLFYGLDIFKSAKNSKTEEPADTIKPFEIVEMSEPFEPVVSNDNVDITENVSGVEDSPYLTVEASTDEISENVEKAEAVEDTKPAKPKHHRIYDHISFNKGKSILKASSKFIGEMIDLADFDSKVKKVNAANVKTDVDIIGNDSDNSLKGGKGDDILIGGAGNDTLTGGKGENTFVYESGDDTITDYTAKKDKIQLEAGGLINVTTKGSNVVFTFEEGGTLTVKNGKNKNITLVDEDENEITEKFTKTNVDKAEELLADLWFTPEVENFANKGDQQFDSILEDDENYSSLGEPDNQSPTELTKINKFKSDFTFNRNNRDK